MTREEFCEMVGLRLAMRRCELGLSQREVSAEVGVTQGYYNLFERGLARGKNGKGYTKKKSFDLLLLLRICKVLRISLKQLIEDLPVPERKNG